MVNYSIMKGIASSYNPLTHEIIISISPCIYDNLTDDELIEFIAGAISHEHIHNAINNLYGDTVCSLYDAIQHEMEDMAIIIKMVNIVRYYIDDGSRTHHDRIMEDGFNVFCNRYSISRIDIMGVEHVTNQR